MARRREQRSGSKESIVCNGLYQSCGPDKGGIGAVVLEEGCRSDESAGRFGEFEGLRSNSQIQARMSKPEAILNSIPKGKFDAVVASRRTRRTPWRLRISACQRTEVKAAEDSPPKPLSPRVARPLLPRWSWRAPPLPLLFSSLARAAVPRDQGRRSRVAGLLTSGLRALCIGTSVYAHRTAGRDCDYCVLRRVCRLYCRARVGERAPASTTSADWHRVQVSCREQ